MSARPERPTVKDTPGLVWRSRADHWVAYWVARADLARAGYQPKTARLWPPTTAPLSQLTPEAATYLQSECQRLQDQMLAWANGGAGVPALLFDGTVRGLIECYRRDPDSPIHGIRGRRSYGSHLNAIDVEVGARALHTLTGRDFGRWFKAWSSPDREGDVRHVPRAHARMTMLRLLFKFGIAMGYEPGGISQCERLSTILSSMEFENGRPRKEFMVEQQANAIRTAAHAMGCPSIAVATALGFALGLRPKDIIGEWLPLNEPGTSDIISRGEKWLYGIPWREVDGNLMLEHRLSKSLRGRDAITDPRAGRLMTYDLTRYPMVMDELARIPAEARTGAIVTDERTGLPYDADAFRRLWRKVATAAGVPSNIQFRDNRSGAITEGLDAADGNLVAVQQAVGHAKPETTLRYARDIAGNTAKLADLRAARSRKRTTNAMTNVKNDGK